MPAKFQVGDLARIGGKHRPLPALPWLRRGRLVKIAGMARRGSHGRHAEYLIAARRGVGPYSLPSYDLRLPEQRQRRDGHQDALKD